MLWAVCGKNMDGCSGKEPLHKEVLVVSSMLRLGPRPMDFM